MTSASIDGILPLQRQLEILMLSPRKRQRILSQVGREIQKNTRKNIRSQKDSVNRSFAKRSEKAKAEKKRRKLLRRMGKKLTQKATANEATVTFKGKAANIAYKHQYGHKYTVTKERFQREMNRGNGGSRNDAKPATSAQARELIKELGYRRPTKNNQTTRVSQRWIKQNMTIGQAGAIIRAMRDAQEGNSGSTDSWTVEIPARAFFGGTQQWVAQTMTEILARHTTEQIHS